VVAASALVVILFGSLLVTPGTPIAAERKMPLEREASLAQYWISKC
jgi:hypothetical protein